MISPKPVLDPKLIDILACPVCDSRPPLALTTDETGLECTACGRVYPINDGIPILLPDSGVLPGSRREK